MRTRLLVGLVALALLVRPHVVGAVPWASQQFGAATTDRVDIGTAVSVANPISAISVVFWFSQATLANGTAFASRRKSGITATLTVLTISNGLTQAIVRRATTNTNFVTSNLAAVAGQWTFKAVTFDDALGSSKMHIYTGTTTASPAESTYSIRNDGSGAVNTDDTDTFLWGNTNSSTGTHTSPVAGALAMGQVYNRALALGEVDQLYRNPRPLPGCVDYHIFGMNGTGRVTDLCGSNHGTITGAIPVNNFVPQLARTLRLVYP